jgi:hypothetical protein
MTNPTGQVPVVGLAQGNVTVIRIGLSPNLRIGPKSLNSPTTQPATDTIKQVGKALNQGFPYLFNNTPNQGSLGTSVSIGLVLGLLLAADF